VLDRAWSTTHATVLDDEGGSGHGGGEQDKQEEEQEEQEEQKEEQKEPEEPQTNGIDHFVASIA